MSDKTKKGCQVSWGFGKELAPPALALARRGDMDACAQIYKDYCKACYNLALRILGDPVAAEDVVQEVFLKVLDNLRGYRGDAPFGLWLKRLTTNATIDALRANRHAGDVDVDNLMSMMPTATLGADTRFDAWSLLMRLPPRARAVLVLHELEGYTHKELAGLFGKSESYSKSILARTLDRLADLGSSSAPLGAGLCANGGL